MRTIEIRRHAFTKKDEGRGRGTQLSTEGVAAARSIGSQLGPFSKVFASDVRRTLETALAMGFAVDDELAELAGMDTPFWEEVGRHNHWHWDEPYERYAQLLAMNGHVAGLAHRHVALWRSFLDSVPEHGAVLVVSHGHAIEATLVAAVGVGKLGPFEQKPFGHLDGVRLQYDGTGFLEAQCLRFVPSTAAEASSGR